MTLRFGVVGTGFASRVQLPALTQHPHTEVISVCSRTHQNAEQAAARFEIPHWTSRYEELLDQEPDAVVITTPTLQHAHMAISAAKRGIHVLCEKPMAMTADEAKEMVDAAKTAGILGAIDFEFRYLPARAWLTQLLADGFIGEPRMVHLHQFTDKRADSASPWTWWSDASQGGGALGAMASHHLDALMLWNGPVIGTSGALATLIKERPAQREQRTVTSDDTFSFQIQFENGALGTLTTSTAVWHPEPLTITLFGSKGTLKLVDDRDVFGGKQDEPLRQFPIPPALFELPEGCSAAKEGTSYWLEAPFLRLLDDFVRSIRTGVPYRGPTFDDGLKVQRVLDAVRRSDARGPTDI